MYDIPKTARISVLTGPKKIEILELPVPEINDDLAKDADIDGVDNLEQLKEHYKTQLVDRKTKQQENSQYAKLVDKICENSTFVCHENIVKQDAERIVKDFESRLSAQGFDVDD